MTDNSSPYQLSCTGIYCIYSIYCIYWYIPMYVPVRSNLLSFIIYKGDTVRYIYRYILYVRIYIREQGRIVLVFTIYRIIFVMHFLSHSCQAHAHDGMRGFRSCTDRGKIYMSVAALQKCQRTISGVNNRKSRLYIMNIHSASPSIFLLN